MPQTIAEIFDLSGRSAIVTGGAMGIGRATALRLAEAGADVIITDINMKAADSAVERIRARGWRAQSISADMASMSDAQKVATTVMDTFGHIDILINNAAVAPYASFLAITEEAWDKMHDINLKGLFFYSQIIAQKMIEVGKGGKIINVSSISALHPNGTFPHYEASKGGVISLSRSLALELAAHDITVNVIAPGGTMTPGVNVGKPAHENNEVDMWEQVQKRIKRTPLGYIAEADEIAKVVLFLASSAADYMTGSVIVVDGGYLLS
ncbi:SDR family NAD(P)-dependent oxidoreductase [Chloroflexota bacterium]